MPAWWRQILNYKKLTFQALTPIIFEAYLYLYDSAMNLFGVYIATVVLALPLAGCDEFLGPRTYDDCILKNLRGVTNNSVAAQIKISCREKFPEKVVPQAKSRELAPWELAAITGRAGVSYGNRYGGTLYNGNKEITVTQVQIRVGTKEGGREAIRVYIADITIPPLTAKDFSFDIIVGDYRSEYSWGISGARGF